MSLCQTLEIQMICKEAGISIQALRSSCRTADIVKRRWRVVKFLRDNMRMSIEEISRIVNRDRSSIRYILKGGLKDRKLGNAL